MRDSIFDTRDEEVPVVVVYARVMFFESSTLGVSVSCGVVVISRGRSVGIDGVEVGREIEEVVDEDSLGG